MLAVTEELHGCLATSSYKKEEKKVESKAIRIKDK